MPSCRDVAEYSVLELQKGLKVLANERDWAVDPGAVDGTWGPRTQQGLRNLMMAVACPVDDIQLVVGDWNRAFSTGDRTVLAPTAVVTSLVLPAAARYRVPQPVPTPTPRRPRPPEAGPVPENGNAITQSGGFSRWGWVAGGITAAVALIALVWWWQKKRK